MLSQDNKHSNRLVVVDDHPLIRGALLETLRTEFTPDGLSDAASLEVLLQRLQDGEETDLVLLDLNMPGLSGLVGLALLRAQFPAVSVIIVSGADDTDDIRCCRELGAAAFVSKSQPPAVIRRAVQTVLQGETWFPSETVVGPDEEKPGKIALAERLASLTPQQIRVLIKIGGGLFNKQIALELGISEATVKAHVSALLEKLGLISRTQAAIALKDLATCDPFNELAA